MDNFTEEQARDMADPYKHIYVLIKYVYIYCVYTERASKAFYLNKAHIYCLHIQKLFFVFYFDISILFVSILG